MKLENLSRAVELKILIDQTEKALKEIVALKNISAPKDDKFYREGTYGLFLSIHRDGSGHQVDMSRYIGNKDIIIVVESTLKTQLEGFKKEVETL